MDIQFRQFDGFKIKNAKFTVNLLDLSLKNYCTGTGTCYHTTLNTYYIVTRVSTYVVIQNTKYTHLKLPYAPVCSYFTLLGVFQNQIISLNVNKMCEYYTRQL